MKKRKNSKKKKNYAKSSVGIVLGLLLVIVVGVVVANVILKANGSGSFFERLKIRNTNCNITNCSRCYKNNCTVCNNGYYLNNNGRCVKKSIPCNVQYCNKCSSTNYCSQCKTGYYLNKGKCIKSSITFGNFKNEIYANQDGEIPVNNGGKQFTCSSSNSSIIKITSSDMASNKCKYKALKPGTATITARDVKSGASVATGIQVYAAHVSKIAFNKSSLTTNGRGDSGDDNVLVVAFTPTYAYNKEITCKSSNTSIAVATVKGGMCIIQHPNGNNASKGTVTITATSKDGNHSTSAKVTMKPFIEVKSIGFKDNYYSVKVGHNITLYKAVNPKDAHYGKYPTYGISDSSILQKVEERTDGIRVKGLKVGTTTVRICDATGAYCGQATVKVTK